MCEYLLDLAALMWWVLRSYVFYWIILFIIASFIVCSDVKKWGVWGMFSWTIFSFLLFKHHVRPIYKENNLSAGASFREHENDVKTVCWKVKLLWPFHKKFVKQICTSSNSIFKGFMKLQWRFYEQRGSKKLWFKTLRIFIVIKI